MKTFIYPLLLCLFTLQSYSQNDVVSSSTSIETCVVDSQCVLITNSGYLFYDNSKTALYLKVSFRDKDDSIVPWLADLAGDPLYFKVVVPEDFFKGPGNYGQKTFKLNGQLFLNGFWQPQAVDVILLASENNPYVITPGKSPYENYKVSFSLAVRPGDFRLDQKMHQMTETISIALAAGRINELKPGMEGLLGEAYNHW